MSRKIGQPSTSKGSGDEPPAKKRKTDQFDDPIDDELWDDDDDFTEAELDNITHQEIMASQAIPVQPNVSHQTSHVEEERDTENTFIRPHLSRSSSSMGSNHSNSTGYRHSRSSSSSFPRIQNSDSSYPASLSGYSGNSSASNRSGGDHSRLSRKSAYLSNGSSSESETSLVIDEVNKMKKECTKLKQKVDKLNEELCVKDGENRLLRDNLTRKEGELENLKTEKVNIIHQQNKQQSEKEKNLETEVARLQTQLQFKDKDERDLSKRIKELETQISALQTGHASTSQAVSRQASPKPSKVIVKDISPEKPTRSGFPTKRTFMATEGSPHKQIKMSHETQRTSKQALFAAGTTGKENKLRLNTKVCRRSKECHLVARLLDVSPVVLGQNDTNSIVGLLNTPWISSSLQNIQFDRDKDTSLLSPIKSRLSDVTTLLNQSGKEADMVRLVDPDNFDLAMKGLKLLLSEPNAGQPHSAARSHMTNFDLDIYDSQGSDSLDNDGVDRRQMISSSIGQSSLDSAILLLPMLQDYLRHYIDMLETSVEVAGSMSGISNTSSSESFESSSESPSGSLGLLLRNSTTYANNLESLAIVSLKTLCTLVNYDCVRKVLYYKESKDYSPDSDNGSSSFPFSHIPIKLILKLRLLPKIIRLATPYSKGQLSNRVVVETCLTILQILAKHSHGSDVNSLLPVLTDDTLQHCVEKEDEPSFVLHGLLLFRALYDTLQHCVENEDEPSFVLHGLLLFGALCKSRVVVSSLCSNATGCVLLSVYSIGIGKKRYLDSDNKLVLPIIKTVIESIHHIASAHKGGIILLTESDCQCSVEVVKCVVLLLYRVLKIYEQNDKDFRRTDSQFNSQESQHLETQMGTCLDILETGLLLLHLMSQHDHEFMSRHAPVQHAYVTLICGMSQLVKHLPAEKSDTILTAIQDLWDFNQDDSELSPDSDTEMTEETE